jgi:hypothetical protein
MFENLNIRDLKKIIKYYNLNNIISLNIKDKEKLINEMKKHIYIDNEGYIRYVIKNDKYYLHDILNFDFPKSKIKQFEDKIKNLENENEKLNNIINDINEKKQQKYLLERERIKNIKKGKYSKNKVGIKKS